MPHIALRILTVEDPPKHPGQILESVLSGRDPNELSKEEENPVAVTKTMAEMLRWMMMNPDMIKIDDNHSLSIMEIETYEELKESMDEMVTKNVQRVHDHARAHLDDYRTNVEPKMVSITSQ